MALFSTKLLWDRKNLIDLVLTFTLNFFLEKSCKLNTNAQNSYYYIKIGLWILTSNFTNTALDFNNKLYKTKH